MNTTPIPTTCSYCRSAATFIGNGQDGDFYCLRHKGRAPGGVTPLDADDDGLDPIRAAHPGVIWHQGLDPITDRQPAWRAYDPETDTSALIRVGKRDFAEPGFGWEVNHGVFGWADYTDTLEEAIDAATDRLVIAYADLMIHGY